MIKNWFKPAILATCLLASAANASTISDPSYMISGSTGISLETEGKWGEDSKSYSKLHEIGMGAYRTFGDVIFDGYGFVGGSINAGVRTEFLSKYKGAYEIPGMKNVGYVEVVVEAGYEDVLKDTYVKMGVGVAGDKGSTRPMMVIETGLALQENQYALAKIKFDYIGKNKSVSSSNIETAVLVGIGYKLRDF